MAGFETAAGPPSELLTDATSENDLKAAATGQGELTVTPLHMVQIVAAIANQGNGVPLHLVEAVRYPGESDWEVVDVPARKPAMLRPDVAEALRLVMQQTVGLSPYASRAQYGDLVIYGHSALAYAGPQATPYSWFLGFADLPDSVEAESVAVVVVVEDSGDPGAGADVANAVFSALAAGSPSAENE
jgi:cell division protein FtsI/penicillin-binding protein 2